MGVAECRPQTRYNQRQSGNTLIEWTCRKRERKKELGIKAQTVSKKPGKNKQRRGHLLSRFKVP